MRRVKEAGEGEGSRLMWALMWRLDEDEFIFVEEVLDYFVDGASIVLGRGDQPFPPAALARYEELELVRIG